MPKVLNKKTDRVSADAVYIGRPSKWGNPFIIGRDGDRKTVVRKHQIWLQQSGDVSRDALEQLRGKDLVCFCAPEPCHGDALLQLANCDWSETVEF